jgi:hypothetical protein
MKKVKYHPEDGRHVVLDVLSTNANGTVNIGLSEDPENPGKPLLVVGSCKITETVEIGSATAIEEEAGEAKEKAPKEPKAPKAPKASAPAPQTPAPTETGDANEGDETPQ